MLLQFKDLNEANQSEITELQGIIDQLKGLPKTLENNAAIMKAKTTISEIYKKA